MTDPKHRAQGFPTWLALAIIAAAIAVTVYRASLASAATPFFSDTDDAMRMVVVRDFLGGQPWYDLTQHRLNTPYGAEIHWSRLVDLPMSVLLGVFTWAFGPAQGLVVTGYVWPMLLLAALLAVSAALAQRLVGPAGVLPALVLPMLSPAVTTEFYPGRVDHHSVVIILTLAVTWMAIEALQRPRLALFGGALAATSLAVATEAVPTIAAAVAVAGLGWVLDPRRAPAMRNFGLSFALGCLVHLAIFRQPARWLEAACDVLSPFYAGMALAVGVVFFLASVIAPPRSAWLRLVVLAIPGALGVGLVVWLYPQCLGGPYAAMDPWLRTNWLAQINEAKPWAMSVIDLPAYTLAVGIPVFLGTLVVLIRLWRVREDRLAWATLLVFLIAAVAIMLLQVRGARLAAMPAMPAAAWLIALAQRHLLAHRRLLPLLGVALSWLAFAGVVLSMSVGTLVRLVPSRAQEVAIARAGKQPCLVPAAFADLAGLPPGRIMAPIDLGSHLLLYTPHAVVAAPYHRAQEGVLDAFRFFNDPIDTARAIIERRGITLVVLCPAMGEVRGMGWRTPDSFASLYAAGTLPDWLEDVSIAGAALKVYAVRPQ